ncbi:hypothetical protein RB195_008857 [Necator americanus]|uniref:Tyrosine-protein kinase n=1 Tax=Necator americanus TaxID=51031 RepID=A0ABR1CQM5_NECAM
MATTVVGRPVHHPPLETNTSSKNLEEQPWYHGLRPRNDIICLLKTPGDWLVRSTDSRDIPEIIISVRVKGKKKDHSHLTLKFENNKWSLSATRKKGGPRFDTVVDLVEYYKKHELPGHIVMKTPIPRPKWLIKHDMCKFDMLKDLIGTGNFCKVFRGTYEREKNDIVPVAIKICHGASVQQVTEEAKQARESMIHEAQLMSYYVHKHVIQVHMQKQKEKVSVPERISLCYEASAGMRYLHTKGCVHRDLAARNCLLSDVGLKHTAKAHNLKGQLPEGSTESLATTIRFVTLNCRTLSSELQQAALSRLLRYLSAPFAALQETRMRGRPVISIENYTIYCGDAVENKVGGCAIAVRNDYKNLVEEFGSTSSRCAFLRLQDRRGRKLWVVSAHASTETAEDNSKDAFYDELNALMSKIPSQQVVIVGVDANAKMGLEQQSDVLGKWYYPAECTSDNGDNGDNRNHRRHQLTWQGSTLLTPEEQIKRKMRTLKLQLDYVLARNIPQSDIRKSRAVWDVAFDSDQRPVLLSFKIRFHKRNRGVPPQPKIDMAGPKDDECRRKFRKRVSIHVGVRTRKKLSDANSFTKCIQDAARETLPVLLPRKKFAFASAETKSTYNSVFDARSAGDFNQEKRLRKKLRRQLQQDRDNEWASRAMEFEKAWEDRNPRKAYALLKHGVAVGEATLPIWKEHFKTLLNRLASSAPELEHVHRPTYAVNEEPPTESEVLVCIQKMEIGKSGGDDGIKDHPFNMDRRKDT